VEGLQPAIPVGAWTVDSELALGQIKLTLDFAARDEQGRYYVKPGLVFVLPPGHARKFADAVMAECLKIEKLGR
jgi:hypothetical protein